MKISIIIPTYNEKENIAELCRQVLNWVKDVTIIIVDDNSPDETGKIADKLAFEFPKNIKVIHRPGKMGLGTAHIAGFKLALEQNADYILTMDADFSHDPKFIPDFINKMEECDMAVGSRYVYGGGVINWKVWRMLLSGSANLLAKYMLNLPVNDCTGGFRCYKQKVLKAVNLNKLKMSGYSFLIEVLFKVNSLKFEIKEVPIIFIDRRVGASKISRKEIFKGIVILLKLFLLRILKKHG